MLLVIDLVENFYKNRDSITKKVAKKESKQDIMRRLERDGAGTAPPECDIVERQSPTERAVTCIVYVLAQKISVLNI